MHDGPATIRGIAVQDYRDEDHGCAGAPPTITKELP
jgi:hypothetical protein